MDMFFVGSPSRGIPPDSDDISQSAYVGGLIVQAHQKYQEGQPFKGGDRVSIREGVKLVIGRFVICGGPASTLVDEVRFDPRLELVDGEAVVVGWIARLKGATFFIKCNDLQLAC